MGTPSLPFHWRIKFKFWPGVFSWRKLRATCRTSQVGLCISGQHACPFLKVLHRCTLCEAPHRVSHYHVVAAAFQSFILPCCLRGTWQSWFVRLHVWPPFQLELRAHLPNEVEGHYTLASEATFCSSYPSWNSWEKSPKFERITARHAWPSLVCFDMAQVQVMK